ncbi:hypothetical protein [Thalassolituus marinus]|uniref:Outer membrane protein beta-barrel domain-containing protein n=1 Tax=Thalassolituus marinus TaxID=671053 RepID=A0ABS7ZP36_9GAMM|nr:hypothetical protein [Thalassolituus marinus]MCA6062251.1 hypothetical protein [Thalassolituus marinus]
MRTAQFLSIALLSLSPFVVQAADVHSFVGARYSNSVSGEYTLDLDDGDSEFTGDLNSKAFGIYFGRTNKRNNRWLLGYESRTFDFDGGDSEDAAGLRADIHFVWGEGKKLQPYLGVGAGLYRLSDALLLQGTDKEGDSLSGFAFQMGLGAKYIASEKVELDIAFERQAIVWEEVEVFDSLVVNSAYVHNSLVLGAAFNF